MILNKTKGSTIAGSAKICDTIPSMAKGLMFTTKVRKPLVFVFPHEERQSFHMMFVFHTIDVIFLDSKMQVVELKEGFRPFTFYKTASPVRYAIELPSGTVQESGTALKDLLSIRDLDGSDIGG